MSDYYSAAYDAGAILVIVRDRDVTVVVHDSSGAFIGDGQVLENGRFMLPVGRIGGLPPTVSANGNLSDFTISLVGAIETAPLILTKCSAQAQQGRYRGKAKSMVNGGEVEIELSVNADGVLKGQIPTPSGNLILAGTVAPRGLAEITVHGTGTAEGQTGTLFGNFLPTPGDTFVGMGVYTGGGGDYGTWEAARI